MVENVRKKENGVKKKPNFFGGEKGLYSGRRGLPAFPVGRGTSGFTLIEVVISVAVLATAIAGAFTMYVTQAKSGQWTEERRTAVQAAQEELDAIRNDLSATGLTDQLFNDYGPGGGKASFNVPGLTPIGTLPTGVVTVINDESPDEGDFLVDLNGNGNRTDISPAPFPLDINGDGDANDDVVTGGFSVFPVVVTVQWMGPYGATRIDLFTIIVPGTK